MRDKDHHAKERKGNSKKKKKSASQKRKLREEELSDLPRIFKTENKHAARLARKKKKRARQEYPLPFADAKAYDALYRRINLHVSQRCK